MKQVNATAPAEPPVQRLFFALFLPPAAAQALHRHGEAIAAQHRARVMHVDSLHMTLAFLGAVPCVDMPRLFEAGAEVELGSASIELQIDRFGYWPHNKILWAGCTKTPALLAKLAEKLAAALRTRGYVVDQRPFLPHVTLLRRCESAPATAADAGPDIVCTLREFQLVASQSSSNGPRYGVVARWALR